ncbi:MAG TPA: TonB family protein [Vicinamibacterales bacterium]|nr:TonB family protein [Vicinamibacterales bacterium]
MYFDFEDYRPDTPRLASAISWREGVLLSVIFHLLMVIVMMTSPRLFSDDGEAARARARAFAEKLAAAREQTRFVFVQPRVERPAPKPPERPELSDQDRVARAPERAQQPANELPFARGNTPERVDEPPPPVARGQGPEPEPAEGQQAEATPEPVQPQTESQLAFEVPTPPPPQVASNGLGRARTSGGSLGDALRNLQRYVETFDNPQGGGGQFGPEIQFDTKGVEFGPWIRRFIAQVKRNWFVPYSAMSMSGHVVIQFNVHKNGTITDLTVVGPSGIEAFNTAAYGALRSSNPTQPLPPAYPADQAFFTVTFFYNETPQ